MLVVDDNDPLRSAIRQFLQRAGCTVLDVGSPSAAENAARNYRGRINLALIDLVLPEVSGPECADTLVDAHPELAVVYMSGYAENVAPGFSEDTSPVLLQKPFARDELVSTIRRVLGIGESALQRSQCA